MPRTARTLLLGAAVVLGGALVSASTPADAGEKGRPVTIHVVDVYGQPITNATVRVPGTEGKTKVNGNGEWTETMLYTIEGDEYVFKKNEEVVFHVSAPEYHARPVRYRIRGRMNYVEVALRKMPEPTDPLKQVDDQDLLIRWFQRTEVEDAPDATSSVTPTESAPEAPAEPKNESSEGG